MLTYYAVNMRLYGIDLEQGWAARSRSLKLRLYSEDHFTLVEAATVSATSSLMRHGHAHANLSLLTPHIGHCRRDAASGVLFRISI